MNHRRFPFIRALLCTVMFALVASAARADERPNIVLILADDMGFSDVGCYGGEVQTPNIDALADAGVRMTQFYNMSRCCPTRASLMTGLYPHQAGVGQMNQDLGVPSYRGELNDHCATIAELLGQAGYDTAMVGKWHLSHLIVSPQTKPEVAKPILNFEVDSPISPGGSTKSWPFHRGFKEMWGTIAGVDSFYDPWSLVHNDAPIKPPSKDFYYTQFIADKSVELIDGFAKAPQRKPFFMYVAYTAPHWPMQAHEQTIRKYEDVYRKGWAKLREERYARLVKLGIIEPTWKLSPRQTDKPKQDPLIEWEQSKAQDWEVRRMATYAAMIDEMDQGIGKILTKLDETGMASNTLVVFMSDNGACAENVVPNWYDVPTKTRDGRPIHVGNDDKTLMAGPEETFMSYGPLWANVSNTPFRSYKHFVYEGGIAAPLVARWPSKIERRGELERQQVAHVIDILPTCLDAAGVKYPDTFHDEPLLPAEGLSLLPALERGGNAGAARTLFWEHEGNRAVRVGDWKLVAYRGQPWQLFDMKADRTELNDLAASQPQRVEAMNRTYDAWAKRCGVLPWPVKAAAGPAK